VSQGIIQEHGHSLAIIIFSRSGNESCQAVSWVSICTEKHSENHVLGKGDNLLLDNEKLKKVYKPKVSICFFWISKAASGTIVKVRAIPAPALS
jgi:hypothetical protein